MKLRLTLVVFILLPLLLQAQVIPDNTQPYKKPDTLSSNVILYSKGAMYVGRSNSSGAPNTAMYVSGSAKFTTGSSIDQKGRTELTGDFINAKNPYATASDDPVPTLFVNIDEDEQDEGIIAFIGDSKRQWIYNDTIDWTTTSGWNTKDGIAKQKTINYINFPTISVEKAKPGDQDDWRKASVVTVHENAAIEIAFLNVDTDNRNRFAVRSTYKKVDPRTGSSLDPLGNQAITSAHVKLKKLYPTLESNAKGLASYSQVDFELYEYQNDESLFADDGKFTTDAQGRPVADGSTYGGTLRVRASDERNGWNHMIGFTPPFEELGADYMFYHPLTQPDKSSITSSRGPIVDPFHKMQGGKGYFMSMEVSHADHDHINERWEFEGPGVGIHSTRRARGGYVFNRMVFHDFLSAPASSDLSDINSTVKYKTGFGSMDNFSRFLYNKDYFQTKTNAHLKKDGSEISGLKRPIIGLGESQWMETELNGSGITKDRSRYELMENEKFRIDSVEVELVEGLNFLGNPFMTPISLNPLLGYSINGAASAPIGNHMGTLFLDDYFGMGVTASSFDATADLRSKYWLINQALMKYDADNNIFRYKVTYDYVSAQGGATPTLPSYGEVNSGQPEKQTETKLTIDPLSYYISPMQMFCLQASRNLTITLKPKLQTFGGTAMIPKSASSSDNSIMKDWFVVEAVDNNASTTDRTSIRFSEEALANKMGYFNTSKGISKEFDSFEEDTEINGFKTSTKQEKVESILYTKSVVAGEDFGKALLGNNIPSRTKELGLFYSAPTCTQEVTLRFYNLDNVEAVPGVWLVDRYSNRTMKVEEGDEYTFVSEPNDTKNLAGGNRFFLRFYDDDKDVIEAEGTPISCYYNSSVLHISGLDEIDMNSDVSIFDMQGRLMGKTKINNTPRMEYMKALSLGTYIVKITGKRNFTSKFANLQAN